MADDPAPADTAQADYVTNAAWLRTTGRPDAIDEVADQFERPTDPIAGSGRAWVGPVPLRWPQRPRPWRPERRAG